MQNNMGVNSRNLSLLQSVYEDILSELPFLEMLEHVEFHKIIYLVRSYGLKTVMTFFEKKIMLNSYYASHENASHTARKLKLPISTFLDKKRKYNI